MLFVRQLNTHVHIPHLFDLFVLLIALTMPYMLYASTLFVLFCRDSRTSLVLFYSSRRKFSFCRFENRLPFALSLMPWLWRSVLLSLSYHAFFLPGDVQSLNMPVYQSILTLAGKPVTIVGNLLQAALGPSSLYTLFNNSTMPGQQQLPLRKAFMRHWFAIEVRFP